VKVTPPNSNGPLTVSANSTGLSHCGVGVDSVYPNRSVMLFIVNSLPNRWIAPFFT